MKLLFLIFSSIGVTTIWNWVWRQYYFAESRPDEVHFAQTSDGWRLALSRYRSAKPDPSQLPVICCHGLGANSLTFDISSKYSFARALAATGREVWVLDLRGHGRSEKARFFSRNKGCHWDLDTLVKLDLPAAIDLVLKQTQAPQVHWIGFSMGGILGYVYLGLSDDDTLGHMPAKKIASAVMLGAALDYSHSKSFFRWVKSLRFLAPTIPMVQIAPLIRATIPFAGRIANPLEKIIVWPANTDPRTFRRLAASGFDGMSTRMLVQLSTLFDRGGLRSGTSNGMRYFDLLGKITTPIFSIAGSRDRQCPPDAVRLTHKHIGAKQKRMVTVGRDSGHREDFGHADLIFGKQSHREIVPLAAEWMKAAESTESQPQQAQA